MEGFFGSVFAVILGLDDLTLSLVIGGAIILFSVISSEIEIKKKKISRFNQKIKYNRRFYEEKILSYS